VIYESDPENAAANLRKQRVSRNADTRLGADVDMTSRRAFLERTALSALALSVSVPKSSESGQTTNGSSPAPRGFLNLHRPPDSVMVQTATGDLRLTSAGSGRWTNDALVVTTTERAGALRIELSAPGMAVTRLRVRWRGDLNAARLILGDAWERGYGDLEWRGWVPTV